MRKPKENKNKVNGRCSAYGCYRVPEGNRTLCNTCRSRKIRTEDPERYAYNNLRSSARKRGIPFTLTLEQFRKFCVQTEYMNGKGLGKKSYTVDRIREGEGYHIDNIQCLTRSQNTKKYWVHYDWQTRTARVSDVTNRVEAEDDGDNPF